MTSVPSVRRLLSISAANGDPIELPVPDAAVKEHSSVEAALGSDSGRQIPHPDLPGTDHLFRAAFECAPAGVALLNRNGRFLRVNRTLCVALGVEEDALLGTALAAVTAPEPEPVDLDAARRRLASDPAPFRIEQRFRHHSGQTWWASLSLSLLRAGDEHRGVFVAHIEEIGERKAEEERLRFRALHDHLTGLANRVRFEERLREAIADASRFRQRLAVLFIDLDNFKAVNDAFGHENGDRVLRELAARLRGCIDPDDLVARFGGDEFAVLLREDAAGEAAQRAAEQIAACLRPPIRIGGRSVAITASIGIAWRGPDHCEVDAILREADAAMYRAKTTRGATGSDAK